MSRPSKTDARKLEALEGAAGLLAQARDRTGILAIRLRQILRRAPEMARVIEPAGDELTAIVDYCDDARELLGEGLAFEQERRSVKNSGEETFS